MTRNQIVRVVTQNLSHNGDAPWSDVVLTQETNRAAVAKLHGLDNWFPAFARQLTISSRPHAFTPLGSGVIRLHGSIPRFTPNRRLAFRKGMANGRRIIFATTHLINSAWARATKPTTRRKLRRKLWNKSFRKITRWIERMHAQGWLIVLGGDFNRLGEWSFPGMRLIANGGLDRVYATNHFALTPVSSWEGPRTGTGRVTHKSLGVAIRVMGVAA